MLDAVGTSDRVFSAVGSESKGLIDLSRDQTDPPAWCLLSVSEGCHDKDGCAKCAFVPCSFWRACGCA